MNTPICDFVQRYRLSGAVRAHMPGHKGIASPLGCEALDITEIDGADVLYCARGIIRESEENAAALFGSGRTFYSTEGSSLPIRAMLYLVSLHAAQRGKAPRILAARNAHKVFITAAALLDMDVDWLYPDADGDLLSCRVIPDALEQALETAQETPDAVYITSPDYLGVMADVRALSEVCHRHCVLLLVDNAHGAYLNFLPERQHPMALGADMCCDSAHKTLPVLTGGAYLHISSAASALFAENAERALALFASTSPSYLILQSLDQANRYLSGDYPAKLSAAAETWRQVKQHLRVQGYTLAGDEALKLTILPKSYGYTGTDFAALLAGRGIIAEFSDADHLVLMLSPDWGSETVQRIEDALTAVPRKKAITCHPPALKRPEQVLRPHAALLAATEEIPAAAAGGRIMADAAVSCPPAIPIVVSGERIDESALRAFAYYGLDRVRVVKE